MEGVDISKPLPHLIGQMLDPAYLGQARATFYYSNQATVESCLCNDNNLLIMSCSI